jgi:hypothetical protein
LVSSVLHIPTPSDSLRKLKSPVTGYVYPGAENEVEERQFNWPGFGGLGGGSGGCNRYEVISARGTGELQAFPTGNRGTVDGILNAVSGGNNYEVMYPGKSSTDASSFHIYLSSLTAMTLLLR